MNTSIKEEKFPRLWKVSKLMPLHKAGDKLGPKQYHPMALLPVGARFLERLVADQVVSFLESEELLHSSNHGFRTKHGTDTAVAEAQCVIFDALERGDIVGMMTLDQSAIGGWRKNQEFELKLKLRLILIGF